LTPVIAQVLSDPVPFAGSDGLTHLVYELEVTNFSSGDTTVEELAVLDAAGGEVVATFAAADVARRLQPVGRREPVDSLTPAMTAIVFLHLTFADAGGVPDQLLHRLSLHVEAAPPGFQQITEEVGSTEVDRTPVVRLGAPLRGTGYVSADSCCDASRHTRATLPIDGRIWLAQRYAVDYEQLDAEGRLFAGDIKDLHSWTIYGEEALAVADGMVVTVIDGLPEQVPGVYPQGLSPDEADGNAVILDLGDGNHVLYAHFQPGSVRVAEGDRVQRGDVLGLVGNSGNSVAPHLHFHVMSRPLSLGSNGLPYLIDAFTVTGQTAGTEAFDIAEAEGTRLEVTPLAPVAAVTNAMPLDQTVVTFD